jgi:hypothetical protein
VIANYLTCDTEPLENSCFCRSDLQAKAENHISTCVQSMCGDTEDATSAVSIYEAYCTSAGFQAAGNTRMSGQLLQSLLLRLSWWQAMVEIVTVRLHRGGRGVQLGFWWNFCFLLEMSIMLTCLSAATTTANAQGSASTSTVFTSPRTAYRKSYNLTNFTEYQYWVEHGKQQQLKWENVWSSYGS